MLLAEQYIKQTGCEGDGVVIVRRRDQVEPLLDGLCEALGGVVIGVDRRRARIVLPRGRLDVKAFSDGEDVVSRACGWSWRWIGFDHGAVDVLMVRYLLTRCRDRGGRECFFDGRPIEDWYDMEKPNGERLNLGLVSELVEV